MESVVAAVQYHKVGLVEVASFGPFGGLFSNVSKAIFSGTDSFFSVFFVLQEYLYRRFVLDEPLRHSWKDMFRLALQSMKCAHV